MEASKLPESEGAMIHRNPLLLLPILLLMAACGGDPAAEGRYFEGRAETLPACLQALENTLAREIGANHRRPWENWRIVRDTPHYLGGYLWERSGDWSCARRSNAAGEYWQGGITIPAEWYPQ